MYHDYPANVASRKCRFDYIEEVTYHKRSGTKQLVHHAISSEVDPGNPRAGPATSCRHFLNFQLRAAPVLAPEFIVLWHVGVRLEGCGSIRLEEELRATFKRSEVR